MASLLTKIILSHLAMWILPLTRGCWPWNRFPRSQTLISTIEASTTWLPILLIRSSEPCSHFVGHPHLSPYRRVATGKKWTSKWAASLPWWQIRLGTLITCGRDSYHYLSLTYHFLLVILCDSGSAVRKDPFGSTPSSSSAMRILNVFL